MFSRSSQLLADRVWSVEVFAKPVGCGGLWNPTRRLPRSRVIVVLPVTAREGVVVESGTGLQSDIANSGVLVMCHVSIRVDSAFKKLFGGEGNKDPRITFLRRAHELDKKDLPKVLAEDPAIVSAIYKVDRMFDEVSDLLGVSVEDVLRIIDLAE